MRVGAFEVLEPVPELHNTRAIAILRPWVDVGRVGTLALAKVEQHLGAKELGRLARPGTFFDFTRYRPRMRTVESRRIITTPNSVVKYAHDDDTGRDYAFLHLREPHAMGEDYTEAVVALLEHFGVTEYCRIGGMYDSVPHTRPLLVTGTFRGSQAERVGGLVSYRGSSYQGPTSIVNLVNDTLAELDVETCSLMVHLPQYAQLNEDHLGAYRLMEVLCALFALPGSLADAGRGQEQYKSISRMTKSSPEVEGVIRRLEAEYDRMQASGEPEEPVTLPPDVENFLREIGGKLEDRQDDE